MSRPDTEDGFLMIALELWPVILLGGFRQAELAVLAYVLGRSYGPQKKPWMRLYTYDLREFVPSLDGANLRRAIRSLKNRQVLLTDDDGLVSFNKHYELWTRPPLAIATEYARHVLEAFGTRRNGQTKRVQANPERVRTYPPRVPAYPEQVQANPERVPADPERVQVDRSNGTRSGYVRPSVEGAARVRTYPPDVVPPRPPIEESRASEELRRDIERIHPPTPQGGLPGGRGGVFSQGVGRNGKTKAAAKPPALAPALPPLTPEQIQERAESFRKQIAEQRQANGKGA
jgi:hypothetical protein